MPKQHFKNKQQSNISNSSTISIDPQRPYKSEGHDSESVKEQYAPSCHDIEVLAYQIHVERGGTDLDNWLEAEQILRKKYCSDEG